MRWALALAAAVVATPAQADRALLIGVGAYPGLAPELRLDAPEEDAHRVAAALTGAGLAADKVTLMTTREGPSPTRAAVLAALDRLAADATRGEQLLIYFSGHGAQAPTATPTLEPDGLDELYLMADARGWDGGQGMVPGAIADKELAARIAAIRARGADVWLVIDSCHAGGAFRGGGDVRVKAIDGATLGIPAGAARVVETPPAQPDPPGQGRFAAFYAAAPGALAIERRLPPGSPDARPLSQFSFALTRALAAGRTRSLRDLAIAVGATSGGLGGGAPEPAFEGALDMGVLGLTADKARRYPLSRAERSIAAGVEEGFAPGDQVRLFAAGATEPFATVAIETAGLGTSRIALPASLPPGTIEAERALGVLADDARDAALLAALAPLAARGAAEGVVVDSWLWRPGASRACVPFPQTGRPADAQRVSLLAAPRLAQCDVLIVEATNRGAAAVDVSPLYRDATGRLSGLGFVGGGTVRLAPGERRTVAIRGRTESRTGEALPGGVEQLALAVLPATTNTPRDLRGAAGAPYRSGETLPVEPGAGALFYRWRVGN